MAFLRRLAVLYDGANATRPITTKSLTSCFMLGCSDAVCQRVMPSSDSAEEASAFDVQRTARMASWGLLVNGPLGHVWYLALERLPLHAAPKALAVAAKVAVDQAVWTPPLTFAFFTYEGVLQHETLAQSTGTAAQKLWPTLQANWMVWPLVHLCTFSVIPLNYRVLWVNCANFVWSGYLSLQAHSEIKTEAKASSPGVTKVMRRSQSVCPKV